MDCIINVILEILSAASAAVTIAGFALTMAEHKRADDDGRRLKRRKLQHKKDRRQR